jgi:hypothetical protein
MFVSITIKTQNVNSSATNVALPSARNAARGLVIIEYCQRKPTLKEEETEVDHRRDGKTYSPNLEIGTVEKA